MINFAKQGSSVRKRSRLCACSEIELPRFWFSTLFEVKKRTSFTRFVLVHLMRVYG